MDEATRTLWEFEAIRKLKYRYFRAVDCRDWTLLAQCLSEDCRARLNGGQYTFDGRDAYVSQACRRCWTARRFRSRSEVRSSQGPAAADPGEQTAPQAACRSCFASRAIVIAASSIMSSCPPTILRRPSSISRSRAGTPYLASARLANSRKLEYTPA